MTNKYFNYLCRFTKRKSEYGYLLKHLHDMDFYSLIPNDDNRGADGIYLRTQYIDEEGPQALSQCPSGPCTVLEMLIGLSFRLEFETAQSRWEKTVDEWFWILIDNLGLTYFTNEIYKKGVCAEKVTKIVTLFLERRYESDGKGGLFPLKNAKKDQKKVEIWYQMSAYMLENYPI